MRNTDYSLRKIDRRRIEELLGAEPLEASGFEDETPDPEFSEPNSVVLELARWHARCVDPDKPPQS